MSEVIFDNLWGKNNYKIENIGLYEKEIPINAIKELLESDKFFEWINKLYLHDSEKQFDSITRENINEIIKLINYQILDLGNIYSIIGKVKGYNFDNYIGINIYIRNNKIVQIEKYTGLDGYLGGK